MPLRSSTATDRAIVRDLIAIAVEPGTDRYDAPELADRVLRALERAGYHVQRAQPDS